MKTMLKTMMLLSFVFLIQACADKAADKSKTYALKGGLNITLSQQDFGTLREIKVNPKENLQVWSDNHGSFHDAPAQKQSRAGPSGARPRPPPSAPPHCGPAWRLRRRRK